MENTEAANQLLKKKYDLHISPEVESAAHRSQRLTGEKVPQNPLARIQNYLNRFHEIIDSGGPERREHNLELIKGRFYDRYVIKPDQIPEGYFENQKRLAREQGHGDIEITPQMRGQLTEVIIADQRSSLGKWIDYLSSPDALYSDSLKYFTLRSVVNMAKYDKEKKMYPQRSEGTTNPFPDLNREALAYVLDAVEKKYASAGSEQVKPEVLNPEFEKLLQGENFAKLYAWAIEKVTPASEEELSATKGEWVKYSQGSDHMPLAKSLQGRGTGWCTAGESTAQASLKAGDFYVYYSHDNSGNPTVPRVAIRMQGSRIAEVRGVAKEQNLDAGAVAIVEEKLKEFPDGESYKKKVSDMELLTVIENKNKLGQNLTVQDLVFLYEIDASIEGFGYKKDPRIEELRSQRNPEKDMPDVFGCSRDQIARRVRDIKTDTKAYVGPLKPGIFDKLQNIEHIYISFPERIKETIEIGGKSVSQLEQELEPATFRVDEHVKDILRSKDFFTLPNPKMLDTVRLKVEDLGLSIHPTTDQLYQRANDLGLELVPAETGVRYFLKYTDQPPDVDLLMGMKPITDRYGYPSIFLVRRSIFGLNLFHTWTNQGRWAPHVEFMFALRPPVGEASKSEPQKTGLLSRFLKR